MDFFLDPNNEIQLIIKLPTLDVPFTTQNNHLITIRFKTCITKRKPFFLSCQAKLSFVSLDNFHVTPLEFPRSIFQALNTPEWYQAIILKIDYTITFSPIVKHQTVTNDWPIKQLDINDFLNYV